MEQIYRSPVQEECLNVLCATCTVLQTGLIYSFTYPLPHSLTPSLPPSLTRTLQHSPTSFLPHSLTNSPTHSPHTHYVSAHTGDEVDDPSSQPANCSLNLKPNVQLYGDDDYDVDDSKMDEDGEKEPPELVGMGEVGGARIEAYICAIETTDPSQAVHLQAAVEGGMILPTASITLLATSHQTSPGDGHAARVKRSQANVGPVKVLTAGTNVVGNLGHVFLVEGAVENTGKAGAVRSLDCSPHVLAVLAAAWPVAVVTIELCVPVPNVKVTAHARSELGPDLNQLLGTEAYPQVDCLVVDDTLRGIAVVGTQRGELIRVPDWHRADGSDPTINGDKYHQHHHLDDAHDDDKPRSERRERLHFVLHESALSLELCSLLLLVRSQLDWFGGRAEPVSPD